jgi:predicted MFS family arabinose efflux permease
VTSRIPASEIVVSSSPRQQNPSSGSVPAPALWGKRLILQLFALATAMAAAGYVRTAVSPLQESIRVALSINDNQMALLQGAAIALPITLAAVPLGLLIDRINRARLLVALISISGVGSILTALAPDFEILLIGRAIAGVAALSVVSVVYSLLADICAPEQRGRAIIFVIAGQVIGTSVAFGLGGFLLAMAGENGSNWRHVMLWLTCPILPLLIALGFFREPQRLGVTGKMARFRDLGRDLRGSRSAILLLGLGIVMAEIPVGAALVWSAPMLARQFAASPEQVGGMMAIAMLVSGLAGPFLGGVFIDYLLSRSTLRSATAILALVIFLGSPFALFALVKGAALAGVLLIADITVTLAAAVMGMSLFTTVVPGAARGLCVSILMAAVLLFSLGVGPSAVSLLSGVLGGEARVGLALSTVCLLAGLLAAVCYLASSRVMHVQSKTNTP